ncbi:MAG: Crp/Fnr family transcriptional regulator [Smithella sp.]
MKTIEQKGLDIFYTTLSTIAYIPKDEWEKILPKIKHLHLNKDEYFVRAGSIPDKMAFIISGIFRLFYITETGDEKILVFREEGRMIAAFSSFLENKLSWFNIQALEDADLLYFDLVGLADYKNFLNSNQCWQTLSARYTEMLFVEKEKREGEFLSDDAETRYKKFMIKYPNIEKRIHQYHIASYLGISPITLSRLRKKLK